MESNIGNAHKVLVGDALLLSRTLRHLRNPVGRPRLSDDGLQTEFAETDLRNQHGGILNLDLFLTSDWMKLVIGRFISNAVGKSCKPDIAMAEVELIAKSAMSAFV